MEAWKLKKNLLKGRRYATQLTPMEREVLGNLAANVAEALIARCQSAPRDELAELTGMPSGHKDAPTDPSLARLLPDFERAGDEEYEGDNQLLRSLHENDICRGKLQNLQTIIAEVGPDGSTAVVINEEDVTAWVAGLNDIRLYIASSAQPPTQEAAQERDGIVEWLAYAQESLLEAVMGPIPEPEE